MLLLSPALAAQERAPGEPPPLELRVNHAIALGVENLQSRQEADGTWPEDERYPGGMTAFTCFTLLKSGVRRSDRSITRGLAAIAPIEPESTYGSSARLLLYEALGSSSAYAERARACASFLVENQKDGLWAYPWGEPDMSNVQFALLALRSANHMGIELPEGVLADCALSIWTLHDDSGAFRYTPERTPTAGVTAATLASLAVLDELGGEHRGVRSVLAKHEKGRIAAQAWLTEHWNPARNAVGDLSWTPSFHYAYLWAVERYGDLTGRRLLGERDWYAEGAGWLIADQNEDGSWGERVEETCFALLFLRRSVLSGGPGIDEINERMGDEVRSATKPRPARIDADAPYLTDWLLAGPFAGKREDTGLFDPPFRPDRLRVKEKAKVGRRKWERVTLNAGSWTDLEVVTKRPLDHGFWALGTRMRWPARGFKKGAEPPPLAACLWFELEDGWRVFLDGEEVESGRRIGAPIRPDVRVVFDLTPGEHVLVVLAEDVLGSSVFGARLSAPDGGVLKGDVGLGFDD